MKTILSKSHLLFLTSTLISLTVHLSAAVAAPLRVNVSGTLGPSQAESSPDWLPLGLDYGSFNGYLNYEVSDLDPNSYSLLGFKIDFFNNHQQTVYSFDSSTAETEHFISTFPEGLLLYSLFQTETSPRGNETYGLTLGFHSDEVTPQAVLGQRPMSFLFGGFDYILSGTEGSENAPSTNENVDLLDLYDVTQATMIAVAPVPPETSVPEPGVTLGLLGVASLGLGWRRKRAV